MNALSNLKLQAGTNTADVSVWAHESQQCSDSLSGKHGLNVRIFLVRIPIVFLIIKLGTVA
jgi:hypothetical protein